MPQHINSIDDVVATQLCTGCGACAYVEPKRYRMADTLEYGRRPFLHGNAAQESGEALAVCPGVHLEHVPATRMREGVLPDLLDAWGPVLAVWEGYAADPEIRYAGSSGGAATALALFCIEHEGMSGALHIGARTDVPYLNETVYSTRRAELLSRSGSRYAPTSPCDGLSLIENAERESIFIGKPCDVAAAYSASRVRPRLAERLGLTIGIFCAGAPSLAGTFALLEKVGAKDPAKLMSVRYRGMGWPGKWTARTDEGVEHQLSYAESWGFLQSFRPWRCYICPDHTGEFADIAVADPWYREVKSEDKGQSLIVARTARGRDAILAAERAGYLVLERSDPSLLPCSQPNLLKARGALWGRLTALRLFGAPVPYFHGFPMFKFWLSELRLWPKIQSLGGTAKRVFRKRLRQRIDIFPWTP
jgi:coenzyme F420 hydrogenase subunit beta